MKAATVFILIASLTVPAGLAAKGFVEHQGQSSFTKTEPFANVTVKKGNRLPKMNEQSALNDDYASEWVSDCYDAYGDAGNAANLKACLKG
ncbi:hypothetical protein [Rhizobium oryziradicis]|uniref:Uncharacterized protein n=1 Tax=Rhizobium oryziradicis TaxID=1867956 RepID=A0A1Q8ZR61_9HYPH|nr:hypothetical protein [Rhizobium oryziradicis]OLP44575.1 hypothetical protein BJF95_08685 [Rhizobium oryziradicis]